MYPIILQTGQDGQLSDLLGMPSWACFVALLAFAIPIGLTILFLIGYTTRNTVNNQLKTSFGKVKGLKLYKNDDDIYDIRGTYRGRKVELKHLTDIWQRSRRMSIKLGHKIPNISEELTYEDLKIGTKFVKLKLDDWPQDSLRALNRLNARVVKLEAEPQLLEVTNENKPN